jgi:subfamily B ATP-binding cassette protein MsbA
MSNPDKPSFRRAADRILRHNSRYFWPLVLTVLLIGLATAAERGRGYFIQPLLDHFTPETLVGIAYWLVALSLAAAVFKYFQELYSRHVIQRITVDYRNTLGRKLLKLPLGFFYRHRSGDVLSRITHDAHRVEVATRFLFIEFPMDALKIGIGVGVVIDASPVMAGLLLLLGPVFVLPAALLGRRIWKARRRSYEHLGEATDSLVQMQAGAKVIKTHGTEDRELEIFVHRNRSFFRKSMTAIRARALSEAIIELFLAGTLVLVVAVIATWFAELRLTAGAIAQLALGIAMISTPIREMVRGYNGCIEALPGVERVFEVLEAAEEDPDDPGAEPVGRIESVEYEEVVFHYGDEPILQGVSLRARPGEVVAIVGPSGAGKTTLVDLLFKFARPTSGRVLINGRDIRGWTRRSLVDRIAVCGQEPFLFNATIEENIRYGRADASPDEVREASRAANIDRFIEGLPEGYRTVVGERGSMVSGGERQRLTIARALLKNPDILILDEPTSQLDAEAEKQVQAAMEAAAGAGEQKRITFVIAHRLSTIKNAHRILVLENGRVVEQGRHDDLIRRGGLYASLHASQFGTSAE